VQSPERGITGNTRANYAPSDDNKVVCLIADRAEVSFQMDTYSSIRFTIDSAVNVKQVLSTGRRQINMTVDDDVA
jgi:hypothetical protein